MRKLKSLLMSCLFQAYNVFHYAIEGLAPQENQVESHTQDENDNTSAQNL